MNLSERLIRSLIRESLVPGNEDQDSEIQDISLAHRISSSKTHLSRTTDIIPDKRGNVIDPAVPVTQGIDIMGSGVSMSVMFSQQGQRIVTGVSGETVIHDSFVEGSKLSNVTMWGSFASNCAVSDTRVADSALSDAEISYSTFEKSSCRQGKIYNSGFFESRSSGNFSKCHIEKSNIDSSKKGGFTNCDIANSRIYTNDAQLSNLHVEKSQINFDGEELKNSKIIDASISAVAGSKIAGDQKTVYIELADIIGKPTITGSPEIIGIRQGGVEQRASIGGGATVGGSAKISGVVSGNAIVRGNAEVHGQATVTGDCLVEGTAKMISGIFTTGHFTDGEWAGGNAGAGPVAQIQNAVSKYMGGGSQTTAGK
jgi:uncharacterized protein YjbI with pentapeptide repeats